MTQVAPRVVTVQVGMPREVTWRGRTVRTGIWKEPVKGRVRTAGDHLAGDGQADLAVHGGHDKAVYAYPSEHYVSWRKELGDVPLPPGVFGENLTTAGVSENDLRPGDRLRIGTAELVVTQPRLPCYKLGIRFGRADMVKRFFASRRSGFYLTIATQGELGAGDPIELETVDPAAMTIAEIVRAIVERDRTALARAAATPALAVSLRGDLERMLEE